MKRHRVDFEECLLLRVELPFMPDACLPFEARPSLLHIYSLDRLTGLNQYNPSNISGGTKPPNSRSISSASLRGARTSSQGPTICTPIGRPSGDSPIGIAVAGRPGRVAVPGHAS